MITFFVTLSLIGLVYIWTAQPLTLLIVPAIMIAKWYEGWKIRVKAENKTVEAFMLAGNYDNLPKKYKRLAQPWKDSENEN